MNAALLMIAFAWLGLMLVLPLAAVVADAFGDGPAAMLAQLARPEAREALTLTLWTAALMAVVNAVFGTLTAWALVRYDFLGRGLIDRLVDLPFAVPTMVTGVMLATLYGPNGWLGQAALVPLGLPVMFAPAGIVLALLFVTFPFVVRSVEPVLRELDADQEQAAATLGASPWQTFWYVVMPGLRPAILSGTLLSFARALGEFGSIVMVSGNIPGLTQTAAVWVASEIESENRRGASAMSVVLIAVSFGLVLVVESGRTRGLQTSHEPTAL